MNKRKCIEEAVKAAVAETGTGVNLSDVSIDAGITVNMEAQAEVTRSLALAAVELAKALSIIAVENGKLTKAVTINNNSIGMQFTGADTPQVWAKDNE